jgi:kinesin family protein C2/C3
MFLLQTPQGGAFSFQDSASPKDDFFASPPDMHAIASTSTTSAPTPMAAPMATHSFSFTPEAAALVARHGAAMNTKHTDGLDFLMQSCTHMLKTRMGIPASPLPSPAAAGSTSTGELAMDAVGPVLETVLESLTGEYERRLLAKDQEHKQRAVEVNNLKRQVAVLELEAAKWKDAADSGALQAAATDTAQNEALKSQEKEEYSRLQAAEAELLCQLSAKRRELDQAQSQATALQSSANQELSQLKAELERYRGMDARYKSLKEENRQLYNQVQDLRGSIRVFCRVRPQGATGDFSQSVLEVSQDEDGALAAYSAKHNKWHEYKFDKIFDQNSRQDEIYQETKPLVRSVLDGFNVCIFAYGQTGSGKTHTMSGSENDGINFRALEDLFEQREERAREVEYSIRVQLVEIYNEVIRDLLVGGSNTSSNSNGNSGSPSPFENSPDQNKISATTAASSRLGLVSTRGSGNNLPDATQIQVYSAEEVAQVMVRGGRNRATAETKMNERSSRSHQVLTVIVEGTNTLTHATTRGCLHLIDLAGSERVSRSGAAGQQLLEAQHINKSLTALGCVMQALAQKRDHIPFRDSKLTFLLSDSLAGQAKSMMFMHVAPEESSVGETLSTLNFGSAVTKITLGAAKQNVFESRSIWEARKIKEELALAKKEAEMEKEARRKLEEEVERLKEQLVVANAENACISQEVDKLSKEEEDDMLVTTIPAHRPFAPTSGIAASAPQATEPDSSLLLRNSFTRLATTSKIPTPVLSRSGSLTSNGATRSPIVRESVTARARLGGSPVEAKVSLAAAAAESMMLPRSKSNLSSISSSFRRSSGSFGFNSNDAESGKNPLAVPSTKGRWC